MNPVKDPAEATAIVKREFKSVTTRLGTRLMVFPTLMLSW